MCADNSTVCLFFRVFAVSHFDQPTAPFNVCEEIVPHNSIPCPYLPVLVSLSNGDWAEEHNDSIYLV